MTFLIFLAGAITGGLVMFIVLGLAMMAKDDNAP